MNKVYVLMGYIDYGDTEILGVFSSQSKAEEFKKQFIKGERTYKYNNYFDAIDVVEKDIDVLDSRWTQ